MAQKPCVVWSLGPKALHYEPKGIVISLEVAVAGPEVHGPRLAAANEAGYLHMSYNYPDPQRDLRIRSPRTI